MTVIEADVERGVVTDVADELGPLLSLAKVRVVPVELFVAASRLVMLIVGAEVEPSDHCKVFES